MCEIFDSNPCCKHSPTATVNLPNYQQDVTERAVGKRCSHLLGEIALKSQYELAIALHKIQCSTVKYGVLFIAFITTLVYARYFLLSHLMFIPTLGSTAISGFIL